MVIEEAAHNIHNIFYEVLCFCEGNDTNPMRMGGIKRSSFGLMLYV